MSQPEPPVMITWTPEMLTRFKAAYEAAARRKGRKGTFIFDDNEFVIGYAKYLIQYLDSMFGAGADQNPKP